MKPSRRESTGRSTKSVVVAGSRHKGRVPQVHLAEVACCLPSGSQAKTPAQMRAAIGREVMRRRDRGRY